MQNWRVYIQTNCLTIYGHDEIVDLKSALAKCLTIYGRDEAMMSNQYGPNAWPYMITIKLVSNRPIGKQQMWRPDAGGFAARFGHRIDPIWFYLVL